MAMYVDYLNRMPAVGRPPDRVDANGVDSVPQFPAESLQKS